MDEERQAVVNAALGEVGSVDAQRYWDSAAPGVSVSHGIDWCGGFVLWALHEAELGLSIVWHFGTGFAAQHLPTTRDPKPGDMAYFNHNQHHAVVEFVNGEAIGLVNGNGEHGAVSRSIVDRSQVTAFYSIAPLLCAPEGGA